MIKPFISISQEVIPIKYKVNDIVKIVKEDEYKGQEGQIVEILNLVHPPVTIYVIKFKNNKMGCYFFSEIIQFK